MSDLTGIRIDEEKALKKWMPIFEILGYNGTKKYELSKYCEIHSILENEYFTNSGGGLGGYLIPHPNESKSINSTHASNEEYNKNKMEQNLLPISVKILTKIENLNSEKVTFNSSPYVDEYHYVEAGLSREEINDYHNIYNIDLIEKVEGSLIKLAIEKINNEIGTNEVTFDTGRLAKSIELIDNKTDSPKIRLNLRYSIKNN